MTTKLPAAFYFFCGVETLALLALAYSAVKAFELTMEPLHALASAFAFEVAAITEAIALARARKAADYVAPALFAAVGIVFSAVYNFAQVREFAGGNGITDPYFLSIFAFGPLLAVVGLALNIGRELRAHEQAQAQAAQSAQAKAERDSNNAAYDAQKAQRLAAQMAHELALAEIASRATAQLAPLAVGGGEVQAAQSKLTTAQLVAQWRAQHPQGTTAQAAAALKIHPSTVGRNWK